MLIFCAVASSSGRFGLRAPLFVYPYTIATKCGKNKAKLSVSAVFDIFVKCARIFTAAK